MVVFFQMFFLVLFQMFKLSLFVFTIKWSDTLNTFGEYILQDYQFKYILHCLSIFYPEPFLFFPPALHIIEWKGSCKELLFCSAVSFLFKSDNISRATFRGGAWVNDIPKTVAIIAKHHPLSQSFSSTLIWVAAAFFQAKQRPLGRALEKYDIFPGTAWSDNSEDLMIHTLIWNSATSG